MKRTRERKTKNEWAEYIDWYEPVLLKPFSAKEKNKVKKEGKFATIDIETQDWIKFVCGEVYWIDGQGQEQWFETDDLRKLMFKCFEVAAKEGITNFVAHYGGKFDFLFFIKELIESKACEITNIIPRGASLLSFDAELFKTSLHKLDFKLPQKITFRDSSALLPFGLGSLTKSFNVETLKGEMDFLFIEKTYKEEDYIEDIIYHPSCTLFWGRSQATQVTKAHRRKPEKFRYWNHERYPLFKYRPTKDQRRKFYPYIVSDEWFKKVTYPIFTKKDLLLYLHNDCKSLHQCINAFFGAKLIRECKKKWTTASQSVEVFRMFLKKTLHSLPDDEDFYYEGDVDSFVRSAYFGGRTEIFKPLFDADEDDEDYLYYYDVNSLYPFVMAQNKYCDKFLGWVSGEVEYNKHPMAIWHCKVYVPENIYAPPLPLKKDERLIFPVGIFSGFWTKPELEFAKTLGCKILEYYEGAVFKEVGYIFKDFIDRLYQMRLDAKEAKDNVTQMTMKLIMNSCYGRMGINKETSRIIFDDGTLDNVKLIAEIKMDNGKYLRLADKPEKSKTMFSNPVIACFVTSYARIHLYKQFMETGVENIYYCDTDSVFTSKPMKIGKELGAMKLEYKCKSACFLLPKTYVNQDITDEDGLLKSLKLTMKGFDYKNIRNAFTYEDFFEYLMGDIGNIQVVEKPRFATFKTALRMGEFLTMKNDPEINKRVDEMREKKHLEKTGKKKRYVKKEYKISVRKLQGLYTKRKITDGGYNSVPLKVYEK